MLATLIFIVVSWGFIVVIPLRSRAGRAKAEKRDVVPRAHRVGRRARPFAFSRSYGWLRWIREGFWRMATTRTSLPLGGGSSRHPNESWEQDMMRAYSATQ
jgi:hypothetical protein